MSPEARSLSCISRAGTSDWGSSLIGFQGSPCSRSRSGTLDIVRSSGAISGSSSQVKGVDTWAPGRARYPTTHRRWFCAGRSG